MAVHRRMHKYFIGVCEITSPAENERLTGMYLQRTPPNTHASGG